MREDPPRSGSSARKWAAAGAVLVALSVLVGWRIAAKAPEARGGRNHGGPVSVVTAVAQARDMPVRLHANGTVTAQQSVDLRAQITSTVRGVHIREGQSVRAGELLFSLDNRTEEASLRKARAQLEKDRADLANARRNLARERELFAQKFVSQAALDAVQNQVDTLSGQLAIDEAAVEGATVALAYTEIRAPFAGRTGVINVRPGSLVQPSANASSTASPALVTVTQIDPIAVSFTLPEKELPGVQRALEAGPLVAVASAPGGGEKLEGKVIFVDNAVDAATGTIRLKAEFDNRQARLWPGMFVSVQLSPRTLHGATVVPAQAVQTGPARRFVYVVGPDRKVSPRDVRLEYVDEGLAVVGGIPAGTRVVIEGAQNLRPGSEVAESDAAAPGAPPEAAKGEARRPGRRKPAAPA